MTTRSTTRTVRIFIFEDKNLITGLRVRSNFRIRKLSNTAFSHFAWNLLCETLSVLLQVTGKSKRKKRKFLLFSLTPNRVSSSLSLSNTMQSAFASVRIVNVTDFVRQPQSFDAKDALETSNAKGFVTANVRPADHLRYITPKLKFWLRHWSSFVLMLCDLLAYTQTTERTDNWERERRSYSSVDVGYNYANVVRYFRGCKNSRFNWIR